MKRKNVLITGAGGFIGSHMACGYAALGHRVTALDALFDSAARARMTGMRLVEAPLSAASIAGLGEVSDLVIHAAALTSSAADNVRGDLHKIDTNVSLLVASLDYAIASGCPTLVFISSSGVFSAADGDDVVDEDSPATATNAYAVSKRCGEMIMASALGCGCRLVTVRLGPVYGPHEAPRPTRSNVSLVRRILDGIGKGNVVLDTPHARRDWTFVEDLPQALETRLQEIDGDGLLHLGSGQIISDRHLGAAIAVQLATPVEWTERTGRRPAIKAPMVSKFPTRFNWTPLASGLSRVIAMEARP